MIPSGECREQSRRKATNLFLQDHDIYPVADPRIPSKHLIHKLTLFSFCLEDSLSCFFLKDSGVSPSAEFLMSLNNPVGFTNPLATELAV